MSLILTLAPFLVMICYIPCIVSKTCRFAGGVLLLSILINLSLFKFLEVLLTSPSNAFWGMTAISLINILTISLMTAIYRWVKENQLIYQSIIFMMFLSCDILMMSYLATSSEYLFWFYTYYEIIILAVYIIHLTALTPGIIDGTRRIYNLGVNNLLRNRGGTGVGLLKKRRNS